MIQLPLFSPPTNWITPKALPEILLSGNAPIALDTETKDPNLKAKGPGWVRNDGFITGISIATAKDQWYFPIHHLEYLCKNMDRGNVVSFIRDLVANPAREIRFANAPYDIGWLKTLGIEVKGKIWDIQVAETLLDEEYPDGNSLDVLGKKYGYAGKDEELLRQAENSFLHGGKAKENMDLLPATYVGPYAEQDARLTYDIAERQKPKIFSETLNDVMALEMRLMPHLLRTTERGVLIDVALAEKANRQWKMDVNMLLKTAGMPIEDVRSADKLAWKLKLEGFKAPKTDKGNTSIKNEYLLSLDHPVFTAIARARELNHLREEFIEKKLLEMIAPDGRLHPHYVQTARRASKEEAEGTRSGRLSARNPNEQQIPKRSSMLVDPFTLQLDVTGKKGVRIGKVIRATRIADPGFKWGKYDFDSQEPRWQCHYGLKQDLPGAREAREAFMRGEKIYTFMSKATGLDYDTSKMTSLAKAYGQRPKGFSERTGISISKAKEVFDSFDEKLPYIAILAAKAASTAEKRGYVFTVLGRRAHFRWFVSRNHWDYVRELGVLKKEGCENSDRASELRELLEPVYGEEAAEKKYKEGYSRSETHKAFNRIIQGSSGDQTKLAFCIQSEMGYQPLSTVHDEINHNVATEKDLKAIQEVQETCIPSLCPFKADPDMGNTWQ